MYLRHRTNNNKDTPVTIPKKIMNEEEAINNKELPINIFLFDFWFLK
nr:hypothetical protein [Bacillus mycoides]